MFKNSELFKRKKTVFSVAGVTENPFVQSVSGTSDCCESDQETRTNPTVIRQGTKLNKASAMFNECCIPSGIDPGVLAMTFTMASEGPFTGKFSLTADIGEQIYVDWGDGTYDVYTGTGALVSYTHDYDPGFLPLPDPFYYINVYGNNITRFSADVNAGYGSDTIFNVLLMPATVTNFNISHQTNLLSLDCSGLTGCTVFNSTYCDALTTLDTAGLTSCIQFFGGYSGLNSITINDMANCTYFNASSANIINFDTTNLTACEIFSISSNPLLTIDPSGLVVCDIFNVGFCELPVSEINNALVFFDTNGVVNGDFTCNNQTPAAPPSGAGATAALSLIGKSWNVLTD